MQPKKLQKSELVALITASDYRNRHLVQKFGNLTMVKAMNSQAPTVRKWAKEYGKEVMIVGIARIFIGTSLYFDKPISQDEAESIVVEIMADYELGCLKIEDLVVACKELKEQEIYGKLTINKILSHLRKYCEKRTQAAIRQSIDNSQQQKLGDTTLDERIKGTIALPDAQMNRVDRTRKASKKYYR